MQEKQKSGKPANDLTQLSPERLELLALRTRKLKAGRGVEQPALTITKQPRVADNSFPLSFAQQRLWFLHLLDSESSVYNMPDAARLTGPLDVAALEQSLNEVVGRHEALRTTFVLQQDGEPRQLIAPALRIELPVVDLRHLPASQREAEATRLAAAEAWQPFKFSQGPLLRAILFRLSDNEHILVVTQHHIVSDAWSRGILIRELTAFYNAFASGSSAPLPELPIQYADYAVWQREHLQGEVLELHLAYWRRQLAGADSALGLPTDRSRPAVQNSGGALHTFRLPKELSAQVQALSEQAGVTLFMTLLAAFKTLLYRYTQQPDVVVGTPVAGRVMAETEGLIGFFVNTLVLRTDLSGNPTFRQLLGRVREVSLQAFAHEILPIEKVIAELQPTRNLNQNPLWQTTFAMLTATSESLKLRDLMVSPFAPITRTETGDELFFNVVASRHGLAGSIEYRTDLFDAARIQRMADHYQTLLESVVADADMPIGRLPLLTAAEQRRMVVEWNDTAADYPAAQSIAETFEAAVEQHSEAVALRFEAQELTYAELNRRANNLAHFLRKAGVGPDVRVGLCVNRSTEMVVGLLGILKAGGAYVPLDPAYPRERLERISADAQAPVIVTTHELRDVMQSTNARRVFLDADAAEIARQSDENPAHQVGPLNLGYVIYTSGSTGIPKGVALTQQALVNLIYWYEANYPLDEAPRVVQFASINFDVSFEEMFTTWQSGGVLTLLTEEQRHDPVELLQLLSRWSINRMFAPVVILQQLAQEFCGWDAKPPLSLRQVITAGSQLQITDEMRGFFSALPDCELHNNYGPSETHTMMRYRVGPASEAWETLPPIGRPFSNTSVYVLDERQELAPIGVPGELCIGGAQVGRGYWHRPELTAEKFIPDPYSPSGGARLYRSGDLVRSRPDGAIEWLGRIDNQVKIRGFRIELGEVEAALRAHPKVREVVVLAREDNSGARRLVAYIVPDPDDKPGIGELRNFVKEKLPDFMLPAAFVLLESLPLMPNGKVDRRALPPPAETRPDLSAAFVAPRTPTEAALADIWADVLKLEQVGINDHFLELGGDSILSIQIVSRARRAGLRLTITELWKYPTITELATVATFAPTPDPAAQLNEVGGSPAQTEKVASRPAALAHLDEATLRQALGPLAQVEDAYPLSDMQQGILFHALLNPASGVYVEQFSSHLRGALNVGAFKEAWARVVAQHTALRTSFVWEALDVPLQVVHAHADLPFEQQDWRGLSAAEQSARFDACAEAEQQKGTFNLSVAPLMRVYLFQLADDSFRLLWSFHDIIIDGWSAPLILEAVQTNYVELCQGQEAAAGGYPYRRFIDWLQQQDFTDAEAFWRATLQGLTEPTPLPFDHAERSHFTGEGQYTRQHVYLSAADTAALQTLTRRHQLTLNTIMQGAWALLLRRFSGEDDVTFGSVVSGRPTDLDGVESIAGVFVNTLPVRVRVARQTALLPWLKGIQEQQLETRRYEWSPLVRIQRWSEAPVGQALFESILAFVNYPEVSEGFWAERVWYLQKSGYPLFVVVRPGSELLLEITYNTRDFNDTTIAQMLEYFRVLLTHIGADAGQRIGALPPLSDAEQRRSLVEWNQTATPFPLDANFHRQFEAQAARTPTAVASCAGDAQLNYAELNQRANRLARSLVARGVGPEVVVALLARRDLDFLVAMLAIFKAGGAYLPLDPLNPSRRLGQVLAQSGSHLALCADAFMPLIEEARAALAPDARPALVTIEELAREPQSDENLAPFSTPANLAYVIYTSGSTGVPKGAMVEQRGMLNHLHAKIQDLNLTANDVVAQTASQCFDISVWQFLAVLVIGGQVRVYDDDVAHNPVVLLGHVEADCVSILETVPSLLQVLLEEVASLGNARPSLAALRWLIPTGEALRPELCARWFTQYPRVPLMNAYGPTECSDDVTHYALRRPPTPNLLGVPIGRPLANMRIYVMDRHWQPVPVNVPGELYVGGVGVGRGYLNEPERTAAAFIPDGFSATPGARLYRTGDLARFMHDGQLEFLGRIDEQVKLRGFRIELGEIEAVLGQHPGVRQSVVVLREDERGEPSIVAYVIPLAGQALSRDELRTYSTERLAEYMIPSAFVLLDALPLTTSGKIDRKALPPPNEELSEPRARYVAPETPTEMALEKIWAEVLRLERVSVHDNFFTLGGHSLLATRLFLRAQRAFGVEVPLRKIFESPTIAGLAQFIEEAVLADIEAMAED